VCCDPCRNTACTLFRLIAAYTAVQSYAGQRVRSPDPITATPRRAPPSSRDAELCWCHWSPPSCVAHSSPLVPTCQILPLPI
jgi:hypothetical protein